MGEKKTISTICNVLNGFAFKSDKYVSSGTRVIRITNVQKGYVVDDDPKYYPESEMSQLGQYILRENDLLMSLTGNVGRVGLLTKDLLPAALNQRVACLRIKDSGVLLKYLFYYLNSDLFEKAAIFSASGIAQKNMSTEWLKKVEIPVPSVGKQQRIVDELDLLTGIIDKKNAQLRDLDTLAQSIFYEMFGNPVTNDKGWPKKRIGELVHLYNGRAFKPTDWTESGLPIVRIQNLNSPDSPYNCYDGVVDEAYLLKGGELLYAWSGTPGTSFGAHIWKGEKAVLNQHIFKVLFDEKYLNKLYFLYQLNLSVSSLFDQTHGGVGLKHITKGTLENQLVPLPNMELQNSFAQKVLEIDSEKDRLKCSLLQTKALLESRMSAYFNTK